MPAEMAPPGSRSEIRKFTDPGFRNSEIEIQQSRNSEVRKPKFKEQRERLRPRLRKALVPPCLLPTSAVHPPSSSSQSHGLGVFIHPFVLCAGDHVGGAAGCTALPALESSNSQRKTRSSHPDMMGPTYWTGWSNERGEREKR